MISAIVWYTGALVWIVLFGGVLWLLAELAFETFLSVRLWYRILRSQGWRPGSTWWGRISSSTRFVLRDVWNPGSKYTAVKTGQVFYRSKRAQRWHAADDAE